MRYVEPFRHTNNDGDALTPDGILAAEAIGRDRLSPPYAAFVSTGSCYPDARDSAARSRSGRRPDHKGTGAAVVGRGKPTRNVASRTLHAFATKRPRSASQRRPAELQSLPSGHLGHVQVGEC